MATQKEVMEIGVDTSEELVLQYDAEKKKLKFSLENFPYLSKETVSALSTAGKNSYYISKGVWEEDHDEDNGEVVDTIRVSPENMRMFTTAKLNVDVKPGLEKHFARPDKVEKYKAVGYKIATVGDLVNKSDKDKRQVKNGGYTDVVLMVRPTEVAEPYRKEMKEYNQKLEKGESLGTGKEALKRSGGLPITMAKNEMTEE